MTPPGILDHSRWEAFLIRTERELGFTEGFKILYCPWVTLKSASVAFLSLNPGRPPDNADLRVASDERGNSYEVEKEVTRSPITQQFLKMCSFLEQRPRHVLTGVVMPFRSGRWAALSSEQKKSGLAIGEAFWSLSLSSPKIRLVVACGPEATSIAVKALRASYSDEIQSGWGNVKIRVFSGISGARIVQVPHLSTFKLFGRPECTPALSRALLAR